MSVNDAIAAMSPSDRIATASAVFAFIAILVAMRANRLAKEANGLAKRAPRLELVVQKFDKEISDLVLERRYFKEACEPYNTGQHRDDCASKIDDIRKARYDRAAELSILGIDVSRLTALRTELESIWDACLDPGGPRISTQLQGALLARYTKAHDSYSAAINEAVQTHS
ncbi:MAG TPA: hypothetical protein VFN67_06165 [Polyangiales bacterium]|nr:hypothetical protein [Polyangiales bacterium]